MEEETRKQQSQAFVAAVLERCERDGGFAANLRRADNPATEHYAYGLLAAFGIDLERDEERRPFALIGAALSRIKAARDGSLGLGEALRRCVESADQGEARLRRMLACRRQEEACGLARPLLSLIAARNVPLCHARLLEDLLDFHSDNDEARRRICLRWAREFYGAASGDAGEERPCDS